MNGDWGEVDNLLDFIDHVWVGLVLIACATIPSIFAARNHRGIKAVLGNVQNGHNTPMREDLDRAIIAIEKLSCDVRSLSDDVVGLRQDLLTERDSRRAQVDDLRNDVDRLSYRHKKHNL